MALWQEHPDGVVVTLHLQPGAKRSEWAGRHGETLKVRIAAPPVEGKANAALCAFLAETFGLRGSDVTLRSGETSRTKRVLLAVPAARRGEIIAQLQRFAEG